MVVLVTTTIFSRPLAVASAIVVASGAVTRTFQIIMEWAAGACQVHLGHCSVLCGTTIKIAFYCCQDRQRQSSLASFDGLVTASVLHGAACVFNTHDNLQRVLYKKY